MPNNAFIDEANNSTLIEVSYPLSINTLNRQLTRLYYRTRHSQVRNTSTHTYAIYRRREQPIRHAALLNA